MNWYLKVLKEYANFKGRARRKEYWYFVLFTVIVSLVLLIVDALTGTYHQGSSIGLLSGIYSLATIIPGLAVTVRRLHDTGRSGWWILIGLIPIIGGIVVLVFTIFDSEPGENAYGPSPKTVEA